MTKKPLKTPLVLFCFMPSALFGVPIMIPQTHAIRVNARKKIVGNVGSVYILKYN